MAPQTVLEERVTNLERELTALKERVSLGQKSPERSWLDVLAGSFENDSAFEEVLRLGREFRDAQGTADQVT